MDLLPATVEAPSPEVVVSGLPRWKVVGKKPPGASSPEDIEDGVEQLARRMVGAWTPARLSFGHEEGLEDGPLLLVGKVGGVGSATLHGGLLRGQQGGASYRHRPFSDTLLQQLAKRMNLFASTS